MKLESGNWYSKLLKSHVTGTQRERSPDFQPNWSPAAVANCGERQLGAA